MEQLKTNLETSLAEIPKSETHLRKIVSENLDLDYGVIYSKKIADTLFQELENSVEYLDAELTKVRVYGKWYHIPRQQVAYGDPDVKYTYSHSTVATKPWIPSLETIKNDIMRITGYDYNFVLINRYRNGSDHIGGHKDDEKEIDKNIPIASLSLGQQRTFVFKHENSRKKCNELKPTIAPVQMDLEHGSLLLMNSPTNKFWYHSLPPRKSAHGVRINLTFRKIKM